MFANKKVYLGAGRFFEIKEDAGCDPLEANHCGMFSALKNKGFRSWNTLGIAELRKYIAQAKADGLIVLPIAGVSEGSYKSLWVDESIDLDQPFNNTFVGVYVGDQGPDQKFDMCKEIESMNNFYRFGAFKGELTQFDMETGEFEVVADWGCLTYSGINKELLGEIALYFDEYLSSEDIAKIEKALL